MFIKLTRFENSRPVWLNASFIVTVEPRREGVGSVVVPIGDGLDYDVRESPETVLGMLEGAPVPTVVPVPVSDCLTKTPADVSPEPEPVRRERPNEAAARARAEDAASSCPAESKKSKKRTPRAKAKSVEMDKPVEAKPVEEPSAQSTPADAQPAAAQPAEETQKPEPPVAKEYKAEISDDQVVRLAKLAPKSLAKLKNTLISQFHVADANSTVMALAAKGVFAIEGNRIVWPAPASAQALIPTDGVPADSAVADW